MRSIIIAVILLAGCATPAPDALPLAADPSASQTVAAADGVPAAVEVHRWNVTVRYTGGHVADLVVPAHDEDLASRLGLQRQVGAWVMEMRCIAFTEAKPNMSYSFRADQGETSTSGGGSSDPARGGCIGHERSDEHVEGGMRWDAARLGLSYPWPVTDATATVEFAVSIFDGPAPPGYSAFA